MYISLLTRHLSEMYRYTNHTQPYQNNFIDDNLVISKCKLIPLNLNLPLCNNVTSPCSMATTAMTGLIPSLVNPPYPKLRTVFYDRKSPPYCVAGIKTHKTIRIPSRFIRFANDSQNKTLTKEPSSNGEEEQKNKGNGSTSDDESLKDRTPGFNFSWGDIFNPDPDNILAVALTGLLAWASAQVLWQLFFISSAILVAALKYSFIAALLIFILITLL